MPTAEHQRPPCPVNANLTPSQAARHFVSGKTGNPLHPSGVIRYITHGKALRNGERLCLGAVYTPGGWRTSEVAIREFIETLTSDRVGHVNSSLPSRNTSHDRAERELDAAGI